MDTNSNAYIAIVVICVMTCLILFFVSNFMFIRFWVVVLNLLFLFSSIATNTMVAEYNRLFDEVHALSELIHATKKRYEKYNDNR